MMIQEPNNNNHVASQQQQQHYPHVLVGGGVGDFPHGHLQQQHQYSQGPQQLGGGGPLSTKEASKAMKKKKQLKKRQAQESGTTGLDVDMSQHIEVYTGSLESSLYVIPRHDIIHLPSMKKAPGKKYQLCPRFVPSQNEEEDDDDDDDYSDDSDSEQGDEQEQQEQQQHLGETPINKMNVISSSSNKNKNKNNSKLSNHSCSDKNHCKFVHARLHNAVEQDIHINYLWKSEEEIMYDCFAPGEVFHIAPPNESVAKDEIPSHLVLKTKVFESNRRVPSHCAHYYFNRTCNRGSNCFFIHAASITSDPARMLQHNQQGNNHMNQKMLLFCFSKPIVDELNPMHRIWGRTQQLPQAARQQQHERLMMMAMMPPGQEQQQQPEHQGQEQQVVVAPPSSSSAASSSPSTTSATPQENSKGLVPSFESFISNKSNNLHFSSASASSSFPSSVTGSIQQVGLSVPPVPMVQSQMMMHHQHPPAPVISAAASSSSSLPPPPPPAYSAHVAATGSSSSACSVHNRAAALENSFNSVSNSNIAAGGESEKNNSLIYSPIQPQLTSNRSSCSRLYDAFMTATPSSGGLAVVNSSSNTPSPSKSYSTRGGGVANGTAEDEGDLLEQHQHQQHQQQGHYHQHQVVEEPTNSPPPSYAQHSQHQHQQQQQYYQQHYQQQQQQASPSYQQHQQQQQQQQQQRETVHLALYSDEMGRMSGEGLDEMMYNTCYYEEAEEEVEENALVEEDSAVVRVPSLPFASAATNTVTTSRSGKAKSSCRYHHNPYSMNKTTIKRFISA